MLLILSMVLIALILVFSSNRGAKALITTGLNLVILLITLFFINIGLNPFLTTVAAAIVVAAITLFYQNEFNEKTKIAFISTSMVFVILVPILLFMGGMMNIQGMTAEQYEIAEVNGYEKNIATSMMLIQISVILMALVGAVIDFALSISSAIYEIRLKNPQLGKKELTLSGMNVSRDILGTTIHTLFYIYMAEFMALLIQFAENYTFTEMINSKAFAQEMASIGFSAIGCAAVIPITVFISVNKFSVKTLRKNDPRDA